MIVCGWCGEATEPGRCSSCGRDAALPWSQRSQDAPRAPQGHVAGRPRLDDSQIRAKVRIALKELGMDATNAELAEYLGVSDSTVSRWLKTTGSRTVYANAKGRG